MTAALRREIALLILWLAILLVLGLFTGHTLVLLLSGLSVYTVWNIYNLNRLTRWLMNPSRHTPETWGFWDEVYYQLYHLYKRQRKARRKLTKILKRFKKTTQALPYATILLNSSDEIEWFNTAASYMFGFRTGLDVGQCIVNLIRQPEFISYLNKREFKKPLEFSYHSQKILLNIIPYAQGQFLVSARDITQRSQLDDMRRDFISNASHELRTPLTVMSGYIEMLRESETESTSMPLLKIQQQTQRMESIISELIELAKLETAAILENPESIELEKLMYEVFDEAKSFDQGRHVIDLSLDDISIKGNYDELRVAFSNLLTNAIRYTPEGKTIQLFSYSDEMGACIGVKDEGIGIAYEHLSRLTERFYRVDEGRSREVGGTGLGLAIVKQILERHGANLRIVSTPGEGSTFYCYFPI